MNIVLDDAVEEKADGGKDRLGMVVRSQMAAFLVAVNSGADIYVFLIDRSFEETPLSCLRYAFSRPPILSIHFRQSNCCPQALERIGD